MASFPAHCFCGSPSSKRYHATVSADATEAAKASTATAANHLMLTDMAIASPLLLLTDTFEHGLVC